jgi:phosphoribosylaminoimidazolecarboxamide formyltransferase / IMP cyclohydrolase
MSLNALVSVSDKTQLEFLATKLAEFNFCVFATSSTYAYLKNLNLKNLNLQPVSELTDCPEILNGRVKTLHPKIFGGILADLKNDLHVQELKQHNYPAFSLVVCNLYPFQENMNNTNYQKLVETIDIGGVSLLRAGAKNFECVTTLCDPQDYQFYCEELKKHGGKFPVQMNKKFAVKVFCETAHYDFLVSKKFSELFVSENEQFIPMSSGPIETKFNQTDMLIHGTTRNLENAHLENLRYGENPHQKARFYKSSFNHNDAEFYSSNVCSLSSLKCLQGKPLSYNNLLDIDSAARLSHDLSKLSKHSCAILKHNTPCGIAVSQNSNYEAFQKAFEFDPVSPFGGIVSFHSKVEQADALLLSEIFLEVIVAPEFSNQAVEIFQKKKNLRLVELNTCMPLANRLQISSVQGGFLVQESNFLVWNQSLFDWKVPLAVEKHIHNEIMHDAHLAVIISKHLKSNAIAVVKNGSAIAVAGGRTNRLDALKECANQINNMKLNSKLCQKVTGAVLASDAFLPFADNIQAIQNLGLSLVVQPGGSVQDEAVIEACKKAKIPLLLTGIRHFKH